MIVGIAIGIGFDSDGSGSAIPIAMAIPIVGGNRAYLRIGFRSAAAVIAMLPPLAQKVGKSLSAAIVDNRNGSVVSARPLG